MLATQIEVSDGTLHILNVGIQFFNQADISVSLNQSTPLTVGVHYVWSAATTITFLNTTTTPGGLVPSGSELILRRNTKNDEMYNILDGGAPFSRLTLDENFEQLLRLSQEFSEGLGLDGLRNDLNMNNYSVINLRNPISAQDAVNKRYLDALIAALVASGSGPIGAAVNVQYVGPDGTPTNLQALSSATGYKLIGGLAGYLPVYPEMFGAVGDGVVDDGPAVQAALNSLPIGGVLTGKPGSKYRVVNGVELNTAFTGMRNIQLVYPKTTATYYHCCRLMATGSYLDYVTITSPAGLVRDDTGFGILAHGDSIRVRNCVVDGVASAAFWATNCRDLIVIGNIAKYCLADGFHISNDVRNFVIDGCVTVQCHDDSFAVVGDNPALGVPQRGVISNCTVDGSVAGHGIVLIACDTIIVSNISTAATGYSGCGSYFWQLTGLPTAANWANNCLIIGCSFLSPGRAPANANNVSGIFCGAFRNSVIMDNVVEGPIASGLAPSSCVRMVAWQNVLLQNNTIKNSIGYGVLVPDANANGAVNTAEATLRGNMFSNIVLEAVHATPATMGAFHMLRNDMYQCSYDASTTNLFTIGGTGTAQLSLLGNVSLDGGKIGYYNPATCSVVAAADNAPAIFLTFNPNAQSTTSAWTTASSTGSYHVKGRTVFYSLTATVAVKGPGLGMKFTLPKTSRGALSCTGRENVVGGKMLVGIQANTTTVNVFDYNNGDPVPGNTASVSLSGFYEAVTIL